MTLDRFRAAFPALERWAWLDTPGAPPSAAPVASALRNTVDDWLEGTFEWETWDGAAQRARTAFARWTGLPEHRIAALGSLAEAAATVARNRAPGSVLLADDEFQSLLLPFLDVAMRDPSRPVILSTAQPGQSRTEALWHRIQPGIALVAVSETTTKDGERIDLVALRDRADAVGAQLFVNGTQSLGVLQPEFEKVRPDYFAAHGYKWLLSPRGAAWLYVAAGAADLISIAPNWKTAVGGAGLFGGRPMSEGNLGAGDTSPSWFSWVGAEAAIGMLAEFDAAVLEKHALELADRFEVGAIALGAQMTRVGTGSQIRVVRISDPNAVTREFERSGVRGRVTEDRLRIGVHGFNSSEDIDRALSALRRGMRG